MSRTGRYTRGPIVALLLATLVAPTAGNAALPSTRLVLRYDVLARTAFTTKAGGEALFDVQYTRFGLGPGRVCVTARVFGGDGYWEQAFGPKPSLSYTELPQLAIHVTGSIEAQAFYQGSPIPNSTFTYDLTWIVVGEPQRGIGPSPNNGYALYLQRFSLLTGSVTTTHQGKLSDQLRPRPNPYITYVHQVAATKSATVEPFGLCSDSVP